jgi:hypothetical protein
MISAYDRTFRGNYVLKKHARFKNEINIIVVALDALIEAIDDIFCRKDFSDSWFRSDQSSKLGQTPLDRVFILLVLLKKTK